MMRLPVFACVLSLLPTIAFAQTPTTDLSGASLRGATVSIIDDQWRVTEGQVLEVSDRRIRLSVRQQPVDMPIDRVLRVSTLDGSRDGALTGFAIGASIGFAADVVLTLGPDRHGTKLGAGPLVALPIVIGLEFGAVGAVIDATLKRWTTIYERDDAIHARVIPFVGSGRKGAALALRW